MNRINPLYILLFFSVLALYSFVLVNNKEKDFIQKSKDHNDFVMKAKEYSDLKTNNLNKNAVIRIINSITSNAQFRKENIKTSQSKKSIRLSMETNQPDILNKFINRVLNERLFILKLEIKVDRINLEVGL